MPANHRNCQELPASARQISRSERGFTLTELIVTVSVAAILATVAVPSFNGIIANQRARTLSSALYATLAKARSTALTLNGNVTLQPKAGGWGSGWQILDPNNNVLDDYTATTGITIAGPAGVTYRSSGRLPVGAAPMFQISTTSGATVNYQCVSVDLSGRPYMAATLTC
jgi:type IV fimbrial biogenesis protein FimT